MTANIEVKMNLYTLSPGSKIPELVNVVIEVPALSSNKYEYDASIGAIKLDRVLYPAMFYPGDYGFIPNTLAGDGDPVDVVLLSTYPFLPSVVVEARPIALLEMSDDKGHDAKVLAVPAADPRFAQMHDLKDVPAHKLAEIEHFFLEYKTLEKKKVSSEGWRDRSAAFAEIHAGIEGARKKTL